MDRQRKACLCAGLAALLWSTAPTAFKIALKRLDPLQLLLYASVVSAVALFVVLAAQKKLPLLASYSRSEYLRSLLMGLLNPLAYYAVLLNAYSLLPAQVAQPLNMTWPIVLALLSIPLLKQKIGLLGFAAIFIAFLGVVIISTGDKMVSLQGKSPLEVLLGVSLALSSALLWAIFWILNVRDTRDEVAKLFLNFAFGAIFALPVVLVFSDIRVDGILWLPAAAYVGLFEMGFTFVVWLWALKLSRTTAQVSIFIYASPFLSLVLIHFVLKEDIHPATVVGLVFIVSGIVLQQYSSARHERNRRA